MKDTNNSLWANEYKPSRALFDDDYELDNVDVFGAAITIFALLAGIVLAAVN
jgi:hypothetical protein